jgi:hypothetical protein
MAILWRSSPRTLKVSFARQAALESASSGVVAATVAHESFFGLNATVATAQAASYTSATCNITSNCTVTTANAETSDILCTPLSSFVGDTANADTTDATLGITSNATVATADARTSDAAGGLSSDSTIATAQGATTDASVDVVWPSQYIYLEQKGFWDAGLYDAVPYRQLRRASPAVRGGNFVQSMALSPAALDAFWGTTHINVYRDAIGTASIGFVGGSAQYITCTGFGGETFGTADVYNFLQIIAPNGFADETFGSTVVGNTRYVRPSGLAPGSFGTVTFSRDEQPIDQSGHGIGAIGFGTPFVAFAVRYLYPTGVIPYGFGRPIIDFTPIVVSPSGFSDEAFGSHRIHDNTQEPDIQGFDSSEFGDTWVSQSPRTVADSHGMFAGSFGTQLIYNLKQIIAPYFDPLTSEKEQFGDPIWTIVENRNRSIGPVGFIGKIGRATIENAAVPLSPEGDLMTLWGDGTFIADANRVITAPDALDPIVGYFGQWTTVWKYPELKPTGWDDSAFGAASIVNLNRNMPAQGFQEESFGTAFIDYAIRYIHTLLGVEGFYGMPDVQLATRYVAPIGFTPNFEFGNPELTIHFNIIGCHGFDAGSAGLEHRIYNSTPQIDPYGYDLSLYGATRIRNQYEYKAVQGFTGLAFGRTDISYRTKYLGPPGINSIRFGLLHIYNDTPDPPGQQYINPHGFAGTFGTAAVRWNMIFPNGFDSIQWGNAVVKLIGAECSSFNQETFGNAAVIGPQYVTQHPWLTQEAFGLPRLDPYTIWCTTDFPPNTNHNGNPGNWDLVDGNEHNGPQWDLFGDSDVSNSQRYITVTDGEHEAFGVARLEYKDRHIYPVGIKPPYIVGPGLNFPQTIDLDFNDDGIPSEEAFGTAFIDYAPPYTKTIYCHTWLSQGIGKTLVEFLNREISPAGWDSSIILQPHRVGPPIPMDAGCGETLAFGAGTWVSYRNRDLPLDGWDDFLSEYELESFDGRMRVTHGGGARGTIYPRGFATGEFGSPGLHIGGPEVDAIRMDVLFDD